jgi:hypothetical protein
VLQLGKQNLVRTQGEPGSLSLISETLGVWFMESLKMGLAGTGLGSALWLMAQIRGTYTSDHQGFWECYNNRNAASLYWEGQKAATMKENCQIPKILQARKKVTKMSFKHAPAIFSLLGVAGIFGLFCPLWCLGVEPRVLDMQGRHRPTEQHPQPPFQMRAFICYPILVPPLRLGNR